MDKRKKIVVIGIGAVGSTTAYTLFLRGQAEELILIYVNTDKAMGDALDMNYGLPFVGGSQVRSGSYEDCQGADIIIIARGHHRQRNQLQSDRYFTDCD